jgi:hypothetical protein
MTPLFVHRRITRSCPREAPTHEALGLRGQSEDSVFRNGRLVLIAACYQNSHGSFHLLGGDPWTVYRFLTGAQNQIF